MRLNWLPWKLIIKHVANAHGFLDPISLMSHMQRFVQPSEVNEPIELLRAGAIFHARGLINSRAIQHNLDWVWPYWVECQFNPRDSAFIPRAFSITHINLSHRNWTAVGAPNFADLPIVDPRGLLTPFIDGWSIDCWLVNEHGQRIIPSRSTHVKQKIICDQDLAVVTETHLAPLTLTTRASVFQKTASPSCLLEIKAESNTHARLVVSLRPYNPEGISFIHTLSLVNNRREWIVNNAQKILFDQAVKHHHISDYHHGDVYIHLDDNQDETEKECAIGMLTAAALFDVMPSEPCQIRIEVPLMTPRTSHFSFRKRDKSNLLVNTDATWDKALEETCQVELPNTHFQLLYDIALRTLILHSSADIYPGPYTYKRFWFRDAAFILHALLCCGIPKRAKRAIDRFPMRQTRSGYFHSQEGEWDANGEVLWIINRYCQLTNTHPNPSWQKMIIKGAHWIGKKRLPKTSGSKYKGLLPAGFSAEHLGPNDYYYWDDFWGIAGLNASAELMIRTGAQTLADQFQNEANDFKTCVDQSLHAVAEKLKRPAMPASPNRRLDAGAIGSIALGYPTQICCADDKRLLDTVEFLLSACCVDGGFFQDMTHSGINAYLTLHLAQVLLRAGDPRFFPLMSRVAQLSSPTGQWPEAIHPRTGGGCMGDGQHVWAAAEWVLMIRACFIREESNTLVLGAGIVESWLRSEETLSFGSAPTSFGPVSIQLRGKCHAESIECQVIIDGHWYGDAPVIQIALPGFEIYTPPKEANSLLSSSNDQLRRRHEYCYDDQYLFAPRRWRGTLC